MEVSTLNTLDTLTNLVFLLIAIAPIYAIGLSLVIGEVAMPTLHPMIKVSRNNSLRITSIRNPFTNAFLFSITTSHKMVHPAMTHSKPVMAFGNPYRYALGAIAIMALVACGPTETTKETGVNVIGPANVCIESVPVVPDTIIHGLTKGYDYKVSRVENGRSRCYIAPDGEMVNCHSKVRGDTLYVIDTYCPATLKARAELGGN
jgi:hypothetical protein